MTSLATPKPILSEAQLAPRLDDSGPPTPPADADVAGFETDGDEEFKVGDKVKDEDGDEGVVTEVTDGSSFVLVFFSASHCRGEFELPKVSLTKT